MAFIRAKSLSSVPLVAVAILLIIFWFGLVRTSRQLSRDGFIDGAIILIDQQPRKPSGSTDLDLKYYTGVRRVDRFLACGNIFLDNITSGSHPEFSLYAIYGAGQLVSTYTILVIEGLRAANSHNVIHLTSFWAMLIQMFSYANIMPLYGVLHLLITSRHRGQPSIVRLRDPVRLVAVIPALIPGFFLIAVLASLPFEGTFLRSLLNMSFIHFPILVAFWQFLATKVLRRLAVGDHQHYTEAERDAVALGHVYDFARHIAMLAQIVPIAVITVTNFFPGSLSGGIAENLTFAKVFMPSLFYEGKPWVSAAKISHDFFICNQLIGSGAAIVWAATLFSFERPGGHSNRTALNVVLNATREMTLAGPAGALIWLLRERDKEVLGEDLKKL